MFAAISIIQNHILAEDSALVADKMFQQRLPESSLQLAEQLPQSFTGDVVKQ